MFTTLKATTVLSKQLLQKYNVPGPRYTSYPTVPYWDKTGLEISNWVGTVKKSYQQSNETEGISLYIHLPYCQSLCTFCGCHKRITKQHNIEKPYIDTLLKEWNLYLTILDSKPNIKEIHLGGGTPTFFSPKNLTFLVENIIKKSNISDICEFSFEAHPNTTTKEHLEQLYQLGFRRNSFGVQDYDPLVQKTINRIQSFDTVKYITELSREIGYTSVSHDLVFGLPHQTKAGMVNTIKKTQQLKPERIAFYSYAHVPWIKGVGQRGFDEKDLPKDKEKRVLYDTGKEMLESMGYIEIGMDHFSLKTDKMYKSMIEKKLHRNFMGYTAHKTQLMIGLGMSSISDSWYCFAQNDKRVEDYMKHVEGGKIPIFRGHFLSKEDLIIRKHILNIMCHLETSWKEEKLKFERLEETLDRLRIMEDDGLIRIDKNGLKMEEHARPFVRNVCMAFDLKLIDNQPVTKLFSMTI